MEFAFLIATIIILALLLCVSIYFNYKHGILILNMVETIENTLDVLDEKYQSINAILEIPLFFDSPQIRDVSENIKDCRDAILEVASAIGNVEDDAARSNQ